MPSWLQPTVPMRPKVPSRLLPCRRRKKCESILEPNLILNNAHDDPLIPPLLPSPPLRSYFLDGKFFIAAALGSTLTKLAIRYLHQVAEPQSKNVRINTVASFPGLPTVQFMITYSMLKWSEEAARRFYHMNFYFYFYLSCLPSQAFCAEAMLMIASILHLGKSGIPKKVCEEGGEGRRGERRGGEGRLERGGWIEEAGEGRLGRGGEGREGRGGGEGAEGRKRSTFCFPTPLTSHMQPSHPHTLTAHHRG